MKRIIVAFLLATFVTSSSSAFSQVKNTSGIRYSSTPRSGKAIDSLTAGRIYPTRS